MVKLLPLDSSCLKSSLVCSKLCPPLAMTLGQASYFSGPQFPYLEMGITVVQISLGPSEFLYTKHLKQCQGTECLNIKFIYTNIQNNNIHNYILSSPCDFSVHK